MSLSVKSKKATAKRPGRPASPAFPKKAAAKKVGRAVSHASPKETGAPKKAAGKKAGGAASHILGPPKGPRNVSHQRIKSALAKLFRERSAADA
jgi:hypothetical protein